MDKWENFILPYKLVNSLIQNYYFGYMMGRVLVLWYLLSFLGILRSGFGLFLILLSCQYWGRGPTSLVMIYRLYLDLSSHGETLTKVEDLFTEKSWYLDIFAKNFVGSLIRLSMDPFL